MIKKIPLHWQILIALPLAVWVGLQFPQFVPYISWMGIVFLKLLKMIIMPLIIASVVTGIAQLGSSGNLGRIGVRTISLYLITSLLAIITGLILVNLFKPGKGANLGFHQDVEGLVTSSGSFSEILLNIVPDNVFNAISQGNVLPVLFFFILFAIFIPKVSEKAGNFIIRFFDSIFQVMMKMTMFIIRFAALGIFGIVAKVVSETNNPIEVAENLGIYILVVILGLAIHGFFNLPMILKIFKLSPIKHFKAMKVVLLTAFSTSSSNATLPLTITTVEEKCGVSNKISSFTLPLGATINMDGTALYEAVAAMFIAQAYGIELSLGHQLIVVFTALLASIGAAGIPMAGLIMLSVVLSAVGLPLEGVGLILAVDRILDMFRTSINVWSDSCISVCVARMEGEQLNISPN